MDKSISPQQPTSTKKIDASAMAVLERFIASLGNDMALVGQALFGTTQAAQPTTDKKLEKETDGSREEPDLSPFNFKVKKRNKKKK